MIMNKLLFSFLASLTLFKLLRDFPAMKLQTIKKKLVEKITAFNLLISLLFLINDLFPDSYTIYKINGRIELILFFPSTQRANLSNSTRKKEGPPQYRNERKMRMRKNRIKFIYINQQRSPR